ncbi:MAG: DNA topoisomerase (ATP-hydrolyzing) subunit B [Planctomycetota bacterium]|nr:DNA topoisomerase (ATP-hydrolyzing) subunit B [Planctomycetota bacterium]
MNMGHHYDASHIKVLEGIEHVRKRPSMYIGDTSVGGLHHLVYEVVDNSIDEAMEGHCTNIQVKIHQDGSVSVQDDGRGIPVDQHVDMKVPAVEVIMTTLHSGGKFDRNSYKVSGGLHGVGVSVVNALSSWLEVTVSRDGKKHRQRYEKGKAVTALSIEGETDLRGTCVRFLPDNTIFEETNITFETLATRLRQIAFLNQGICVDLLDERHEKHETYNYEGGITEFVTTLNENKDLLHEDVIFIEKEQDKVWIQIALQYNQGFRENLLSFVNNIHTKEGGTHVSGFRSALTRTLNSYARKYSAGKNEKIPGGDDYREGLTGVISVRVPDPQFEGQTKTKLGNRDVQGLVEAVVNDVFNSYLEENPSTAKAIVKKALTAAQHREAVRKLRDAQRKGALQSGSLPGKLSDCVSHDIDSSELFLVEGDSAAGTAKSGRNRQFQAILPLRGKILNVEKAHLAKMLSHGEINTIIRALGTQIGEEDFDLEKLRYGKIVIMTDADVDGSHIRTLLLTFFFRHMQQLIETGHVYLAQPPLYKIKRGKREEYLHTEEDMDKVLLQLGSAGGSLRYGDRHLSEEEFQDLLAILIRLEMYQNTLHKRGLTLKDLLSERDRAGGNMPTHLAIFGDQKRFINHDRTNDETLAFFRGDLEEELNFRDDQEFDNEITDHCVLRIELLVSKKIEEIIASLEPYDISIHDFNGTGSNGSTAFHYHIEEQVQGYPNLSGLLEGVRTLGRKGISLQRYKGLGEMNSEELWETTMNPESRNMVQVHFEDGVKADRMFSVLMGSGVAPRRRFIERFALEVHHLDV